MVNSRAESTISDRKAPGVLFWRISHVVCLSMWRIICVIGELLDVWDDIFIDVAFLISIRDAKKNMNNCGCCTKIKFNSFNEKKKEKQEPMCNGDQLYRFHYHGKILYTCMLFGISYTLKQWI